MRDSIGWREEWSIGIYSGESPLHIAAAAGVKNPVLTREDVSDVRADFVADPFMIRAHGMWHMFFEVMNAETGKGKIGLATSDDGLTWTYQRIVLAEPFHLSYPHVFEWNQQFYMVPESYMAGSVRLYQAIVFPSEWHLAAVMLTGAYYADPSIIRYGDRWWLFVDASPAMQHDTLRLFWSETLGGPWHEHAKNPIVADNPHIARPAGRPIVLNDTPIRFAQDCYPTYGRQVRAFAITELNTTRYEERGVGDHPIVGASGEGWNGSGMHQIDAHLTESGGWIACVDGLRQMKL